LGSAFRAEVAETNRRRLAIILPLLIVTHAIYVAVFATSAAERATLPAQLLRWRSLLVLGHATAGGLALPLALLARRTTAGWTRRALGPAAALLYVLHGAFIAGADQLMSTSVTPFIGCALGTAVVVCLSPAEALAVYAAGIVAFVAAIASLQPSASGRLSALPNGFSVVGLAVALSWLLYQGRRRDFVAGMALRDSERKFRALFDGLDLAVTVRDVDTQKLLDCNPAALRLFGYASVEELGGTTPIQTSASVQLGGRTLTESLGEHVGRALRDRVARTGWVSRRRGGETFEADLRTTVIALEDGSHVMQTVIDDVTERRRTHALLERRAERDQLLGDVSRRFLNDDPEAATGVTVEKLGITFGAASVSLFVLDADGIRLRRTHRWTAADTEEALEPLEGHPVPPGAFVSLDDGSASAHRGDADALLEPWLEALRRDAGRGTLHATVGYGAQVYGLLETRAREGRSWTADDGATLRMVGELIAVGRVRKAAEMALARATRDAIAASTTKSAFLANMSHELRTPMNGVIGMVDLLSSTPLDERQRRYTEVARSSASLLLSVINDVLDFSKIEAGKLEMETVAFEPNEILEGVTSILALSADQKGIELASESSSALSRPLVGDPARLRQVLVNLVSNAIKFTRRGEVVVRASGASESAESVRVRVEVHDTGDGIPYEAQARLFQPFTQLDASTTRVHGGTGLGLAICRGLIERMTGTLGLESEPGRGSTFWFEVPFRKASLSPVETVREPRLDGVRILAIDDSEASRAILRAGLTNAGAACDTAASGDEALRMLVEAAPWTPYAIAVVDQQMPGVDGRDVARRIRDDPRLAVTKVVMLGSLTRPVSDADLRELGVAGYFTKPLWRRQLLRVLRSALDGKPAPENAAIAEAYPRAKFDARVLLVEDSVINAELAGEILHIAGYSFDAAGDGARAVEAARTGNYDLILMDCHLPGMDGYEATRRIRALEAASGSRRVPIIALSAGATQGDIDACFAAGMDAHVTKPVDARWLLGVVAAQLEPLAGDGRATVAQAPTDGRAARFSRVLERLGGNRALLRRLAALFSERVPASRATLHDAVATQAVATVRFETHRLKGQASTFDGLALVAALEALDGAAKQGRWTAASAELVAVERELDELLRTLSASPETRPD
jgi:PAS domain S-box-containing protein